MKAFIVRPFGTKEGINFDDIEAKLIQPALKALNITGGTTGEILESGDIREDMFNELLMADLVVADLSIHNANVFYELGVRHALRTKRTFLIRCEKDDVPFDINTNRYLAYDHKDPAACLMPLIEGLKSTLYGERVDSPVFLLLPRLVEQDTEHFLAVHQQFADAVETAHAKRRAGDLRLMAIEIENLPWELVGLRLIGEQTFDLRSFPAALEIWERVLKLAPDDRQALERLSTIYQRLGQLDDSDLAIKKLLRDEQLSLDQKVEAHALLGRNYKVRWLDTWRKDEIPSEVRPHRALDSSWLLKSIAEYDRGFSLNLNHYYSGINALGLLTVLLELVEAMPEVWSINFDTEEEATYELNRLKKRHQDLSVLVDGSLESARLNTQGPDIWLDISSADLQCLISDKPERVAKLYRDALNQSSVFVMDSARQQILIYEDLGVRQACVRAALDVLPRPPDGKKATHTILFTGHMIDAPDRKNPRFPAEKEEVAREAIRREMVQETARVRELYGKGTEVEFLGIAGGACGGDILFHEICHELGIATNMYLPFPREHFLETSVKFAGLGWIERFNAIYERLEPDERPVLGPEEALPPWLHTKTDYNVWIRNNLWMLNNALVEGGQKVTLIALWNGEGGDGLGGTQDMVDQAAGKGAKVVVIDTKEEFGLQKSSEKKSPPRKKAPPKRTAGA